MLVDCPVAEIGLGRPQVVPVGFGLHPDPLDRDELAPDAEQLLDNPLGLLMATLAEVLVDDDAVGVDDVGTDIRLLAQPVDAAQGPEVAHQMLAAQLAQSRQFKHWSLTAKARANHPPAKTPAPKPIADII